MIGVSEDTEDTESTERLIIFEDRSFNGISNTEHGISNNQMIGQLKIVNL